MTDLLYQTTTELIVFESAPTLNTGFVHSVLIGDREKRTVNRWAPNHPLEAAYVLELICRWAEEDGTSSTQFLDIAREKGLEMVEPRLALRVLNQELPVRGFEHAAHLAQQVLERRNTDTAYSVIEAWLALNASAYEELVRRSRPRVIVKPRLARPAGRVPENPYQLF